MALDTFRKPQLGVLTLTVTSLGLVMWAQHATWLSAQTSSALMFLIACTGVIGASRIKPWQFHTRSNQARTELDIDVSQAFVNNSSRLSETEITFRNMVESIKDYAIILLDPNGKIISWNAGAQRLKGYAAREAIGKSFEMFYTPNDLQLGKPQTMLAQAQKLGVVEDTGWRVRNDGSLFLADVVITALFDPKGKLKGYTKITRDITESQVAANKLRNSKRLFSSVINNIPTIFFMKDAKHLRFVLLNKAFEEFIGVTRKEMIGKNDYDFFPKEEADFFTEKDRMALAQGFVDIPEETVETKHGKRIVHTRKIALRDGRGNPKYLVGIAHDITDQKRFQNANSDQTQRLQAVLDNVIDGIITINQRGTVESFSKRAESIFGYAADEVIGQNIKMLMPDDQARKHDGYIQNYQQTGQARIIGIGREVEGKRKNGEFFPMDLAITEISRGSESLYIGMVRDITERKRIERMKTEFVSTVSHELRTPLTSITGALGLLAGGVIAGLTDEAKTLVTLGHQNCKRLTLLINDLLDMEKMAAGKMRVELIDSSLLALVQQSIDEMHPYGDQFHVQFSLVESINDLTVVVDPQRLMQVLTNFLSNAAKFSPTNSDVEIRIQHLPGELVRVSVTDHGAGIPEEFQSRIFQKFSQADSSDTRKKGGTGLGLAISKELANLMGCKVGFTSVKGEGSCFYIDIPTQRANESGLRMTG